MKEIDPVGGGGRMPAAPPPGSANEYIYKDIQQNNIRKCTYVHIGDNKFVYDNIRMSSQSQ